MIHEINPHDCNSFVFEWEMDWITLLFAVQTQSWNYIVELYFSPGVSLNFLSLHFPFKNFLSLQTDLSWLNCAACCASKIVFWYSWGWSLYIIHVCITGFPLMLMLLQNVNGYTVNSHTLSCSWKQACANVWKSLDCLNILQGILSLLILWWVIQLLWSEQWC